MGGLLHNSGADGIALLENFLRGRPLADQARDEGLRAGILVRLADAVQQVRGGEAANGDVEAGLLVQLEISELSSRNCD